MNRWIIILLFPLLFGCSTQQIEDAFSLSMAEYDHKYSPDKRWKIEDIHVYVNMKYREREQRFLDGCLRAAERKYEMALAAGYNENDLEIIVIQLRGNIRNKSYRPTHAILRHKDTIYDNGFIDGIPFDIKYLSHYGEIIPDQWSRYRVAK